MLLLLLSLPLPLQTISPGMVDTDILPQQLQGVVKQHMPMLRAQDVAEAVLWTIGTPSNVQVSYHTYQASGCHMHQIIVYLTSFLLA